MEPKITFGIRGKSLFKRLEEAFGPVAAGLLIDFADLVSWGPLGLMFGWILGAFLGWWLGGIYRFNPVVRSVVAILSGLYCAFPLTTFLPLATVVGCFARFIKSEK